jgi:peptidoglycan/LPS O-acetylase OafA/YrhL
MLQATSTRRSLPTSTTAASGPKFQTDVEGLRAVAVLSVVAFHASVPYVSKSGATDLEREGGATGMCPHVRSEDSRLGKRT